MTWPEAVAWIVLFITIFAFVAWRAWLNATIRLEQDRLDALKDILEMHRDEPQ